MTLSTHVLDTAAGRPAVGVPVSVSLRGADGGWSEIATTRTDADGRCAALVPDGLVAGAVYRIRFDVEAYAPDAFFPEATVTFRVRDPDRHHHVPLLLSPFAHSTYLGS